MENDNINSIIEYAQREVYDVCKAQMCNTYNINKLSNINITVTVQPVHALRIIEIEIPLWIIYPNKTLRRLEDKKSFISFQTHNRYYIPTRYYHKYGYSRYNFNRRHKNETYR